MNLENIEVGQIFKNHIQLCVKLGIEPQRRGNGKKYQIREIERYLKFERVVGGNSIIIKEIYGKIKDKIDMRSEGNSMNEYIKDGELLLIDLLLCSKHDEILLPNTALLLALKMVNSNYSKYYGANRPLLAKGLDIEIEYIHDYLENVGLSLGNSIQTIISRLEKRKLIHHTEVTMIKAMFIDAPYTSSGEIIPERVIEYTEDGVEIEKFKIPQMRIKGSYREASKIEIKNILDIERQEFLKLGFKEGDTRNLLYKDGLIHKFNKSVKDRVYNELGIARHYIAHRIIFNQHHLEDERVVILEQMEKKMTQDGMNKKIIDRIMENAKNRNITALDKIKELVGFGDVEGKVSKKYVNRADDKYLESYDILNQFLIDNNITQEKENELFKFKENYTEIELPLNM